MTVQGDIKTVHLKPPIVARDFATALGLKPFKLISELMEMGIFASMNQNIEEAVAIGTTLVMLSARPSRVRELIKNDGHVERAKLVDDLNTMIMEEVERQQGAGPGA